MGKKDIQQSNEESRGFCRQCLKLLLCCHLSVASGVKIVSIVSILIGLVFCCLGVWMIIVTTNNIELAPRNQVVFELHPAPPMSSFSSTGNGPPAPSSVHNTAVSSGDRSTISTQSSLDTSSVYLTASSASSSSSSSSTSSTHPGTSGSSSSWPSQSISASKGPSGRKPPFMNHTGPKKLIPLANYHNYLLCLGILSICVGFVRALASSFLLWNSVEKHSKTPGAVWILSNIVGTVGVLVFLCVTLNVTGFINDFPWRPMSVQNDRFNFYLLFTMFRIVCICDIFLSVYFVLVVLWFVRSLH